MQELTYNNKHIALIWSGILALFVCAGSYAWSSNSMMVATMRARQFEAKSTDVSTKIAALEMSLAALHADLTLEQARTLGFVDAAETAYVGRSTAQTAVAQR